MVNLKTEYKVNLIIEVEYPRLSYELIDVARNQFQTAYQIIDSSSLEKANQKLGDIWDSGKINSDKSNQIEFSGK